MRYLFWSSSFYFWCVDCKCCYGESIKLLFSASQPESFNYLSCVSIAQNRYSIWSLFLLCIDEVNSLEDTRILFSSLLSKKFVQLFNICSSSGHFRSELKSPLQSGVNFALHPFGIDMLSISRALEPKHSVSLLPTTHIVTLVLKFERILFLSQ